MKIVYQFSRFFSFLLFLLFLGGCSSPSLDQVGADGTILAFGDSLTVGVGATGENNYPSLLSQMSGIKIINAGVSGETTSQGLMRFAEELDRTSPNLVILIEGGNDILQNQNPSQIKANLRMMIEEAKKRQIPIVLIGIPQKKLFSDSAPFYSELAEEYHLVFDDDLIASLMRSPSLKSDPVHFNNEGYQQMAQAIYDLLKENGALR